MFDSSLYFWLFAYFWWYLHIETRHGPDKIYISETRSNLGNDDCVLNLGSGGGGQDDDHNWMMLSSNEMVKFWWFLVRFQHLSLFVYFRRIICWRRQFLVAWNDAWFCLTSYAGSINNRRAPVSVYQNTSPLLLHILVLRCRHSMSDTFHGNYCMKCKIGWKMQNWVQNGQIVRWEANCGDLGQVEREVEGGRWDIWCWKVRWATSLKGEVRRFFFIGSKFLLAPN